MVVFIRFSLGFTTLGQDFKQRFLSSFTNNPFRKQSAVNLSLSDLKLKMDFDLLEEDKSNFQTFTNNWFGVSGKISNLQIGIDENLKTYLTSSLPLKLNLVISDKNLEFKSQIIPGLKTTLVKNDFEFATRSGKIQIKYSDQSKYQVLIENPTDLANYATSSGILSGSDKISRLFQTLPKVATIELTVSGKNVSGNIKLK